MILGALGLLRAAAFRQSGGMHTDITFGPLDAGALPEALALLEGSYWNEGISQDVIARSLLASTVWLGARDRTGTVIAMARALSDVSKVAWIFDVVVRPDWRGKGLGQEIMRRLLEHPAVRDARKVRLNTRDAHGLYEKFGFRTTIKAETSADEMVLDRA